MHVTGNKLLLLGSSVATLVFLGAAAYRENFGSEWRRIQRAYARRLPAESAAEFQLQLRQVVVPALEATDRCVSCHVGMAPGENPAQRHALFGKHPDVVHDPAEYGCTVCHGGQGRATERAAAHGDVAHWPEPMIPRRFASAGCGTCHSHLEVPNLAALERGRTLIERLDCLACHGIDGRGGTLRPDGGVAATAPDLSRSGATGIAADWQARHRDASDSLRMQETFPHLALDESRAIETYLASRVGAPGLVEAKAVFHSLGCRGCHKVGGVGGDDGPDLTRVGQMDPGQRSFREVRAPGWEGVGAHSVAAWLAEHFRRPGAVVPGSAMPDLGLGAPAIEALTLYMLSLRRSALPEAYWPADRIRAERFGKREFAVDGATLYGTFCAACHGNRGQGMRFAGAPAFPAIGNPDFLAHASDELIRQTITHGRRGRRMPAWGETSGGLRPAEIDSVVAYVRALGGGIRPAPEDRPRRWVRGDLALGRTLFASSCAPCHGAEGGGGEGPSLRDPTLLAHATDTYLFETTKRGRRGTSMEGFGAGTTTRRALSDAEIESILVFIRSWEETGRVATSQGTAPARKEADRAH
jgi:mono/diheme cytochrome c family protein